MNLISATVNDILKKLVNTCRQKKRFCLKIWKHFGNFELLKNGEGNFTS